MTAVEPCAVAAAQRAAKSAPAACASKPRRRARPTCGRAPCTPGHGPGCATAAALTRAPRHTAWIRTMSSSNRRISILSPSGK
eukprot:scaffold64676_cov82-Phaeocystis_antarctica.AAC.4